MGGVNFASCGVNINVRDGSVVMDGLSIFRALRSAGSVSKETTIAELIAKDATKQYSVSAWPLIPHAGWGRFLAVNYFPDSSVFIDATVNILEALFGQRGSFASFMENKLTLTGEEGPDKITSANLIADVTFFAAIFPDAHVDLAVLKGPNMINEYKEFAIGFLGSIQYTSFQALCGLESRFEQCLDVFDDGFLDDIDFVREDQTTVNDDEIKLYVRDIVVAYIGCKMCRKPTGKIKKFLNREEDILGFARNLCQMWRRQLIEQQLAENSTTADSSGAAAAPQATPDGGSAAAASAVGDIPEEPLNPEVLAAWDKGDVAIRTRLFDVLKTVIFPHFPALAKTFRDEQADEDEHVIDMMKNLFRLSTSVKDTTTLTKLLKVIFEDTSQPTILPLAIRTQYICSKAYREWNATENKNYKSFNTYAHDISMSLFRYITTTDQTTDSFEFFKDTVIQDLKDVLSRFGKVRD